MFDRLFLDHPRSVGESYAEHARVAGRFGVTMILGGIGCLVHAAVPALCRRTGSDTVRRLHARLSGREPTPAELTYDI
jgi:hypothetical protein